MGIEYYVNDPDQINQKPLSEQETRKAILHHAKIYGIEREIAGLFDKYDAMIRNCPNKKEADDIKKMAIIDIVSRIGGTNYLTINGEVVIDDTKIIK